MKSRSAKPPTGPVPLADADTHGRLGVPWCCRDAGTHERRHGRNALAPGAARAARSRAPHCTQRKLALTSWRTRVHVRCRPKEHVAVPAPGRPDGSSMKKRNAGEGLNGGFLLTLQEKIKKLAGGAAGAGRRWLRRLRSQTQAPTAQEATFEGRGEREEISLRQCVLHDHQIRSGSGLFIHFASTHHYTIRVSNRSVGQRPGSTGASGSAANDCTVIMSMRT